MRLLSKWSLLLGGGTFMVACEEEGSMDDNPASSTGTLKLNISNLEMLDKSEIYEAWIIVDGAPVSAGTFNVDNNGMLTKNELSVDRRHA